MPCDIVRPSYRFPMLAHMLGADDSLLKINEEMLAKYPDADFYDFGPDLNGYPVLAVNNLDVSPY